MAIHKNEISERDMQNIHELRSLVKGDLTSYYDTDFNLLRWLQGHSSLSIPEIARKLTHHLKLRKSYWDLDSYTQGERNHPIHNHWRRGITGKSQILENVIVNVEQCGTTDYSGMMESFSVSEIMRARTYDLEEMLASCMRLEEETGKQAWILYVMDITGLEYNKKLYDLVTGSMKALADFMAEHYVEMIKFFVPVAMPTFATALYTVLRPLLPERTKHKVVMLSSAHWKEEILQYAQADALPSFWNEGKHSFSAKLELPCKYPIEKYYANLKLKAPVNAEHLNILAGKSHVQTFELKKNDRISWWIMGNRNMGFGFFKAEKENENDFDIMSQITPSFPGMPGPLLVPLEEEVTIKEDGTYKIWLDNSRSWWFTLTVTQLIEIHTVDS
ncbi:unnamed protein product [Auanema sp. JU1783]|nr:unnamed protein product [Auanema sp. JU1783]